MEEKISWTVEAVKRLGDIETAGQILGIGRTKAYEMARAGTFPVRVIRVGRRFVLPPRPYWIFWAMAAARSPQIWWGNVKWPRMATWPLTP